jgi:hypothetical protein
MQVEIKIDDPSPKKIKLIERWPNLSIPNASVRIALLIELGIQHANIFTTVVLFNSFC